MPAKEKVSLTRQTIYCFIPIMDLYAAYHIKKLRLYLLIFLGVTIPLSMVLGAVYPGAETDMYNQKSPSFDPDVNWDYDVIEENPENVIISFVIQMTVAYALAVYLIRRWSNKWNLQFNVN